jgi:hypothetical protein
LAEHVIEELKLQFEPSTDLLMDVLLGATPNWRQKRAGVRVEDYWTLAKANK